MRVLIAMLFFASLLPVNIFARVQSFYPSDLSSASQNSIPDLENWNIFVRNISSITITVSIPSDLQGAFIERSEDQVSFQIIDTIQGPLNKYIDQNLKKGTLYFYRIRLGISQSKTKRILVDESGAWSYLGVTPFLLELNHAAVSDNNNIYGGFGTSKEWVYKSDKNIWSEIADPGIQVTDPSVSQDNDNAYLAFGHYNKVLLKFNFENDTWSRLDSFQSYKSCVSSFVIKDRIYFAGGMDLIPLGVDNWIEKPARSVWEYNLKNNKWNKLQDLPFDSVFNCPVVVKDGIAYLLYKGKYVWEFDANNKKSNWNIHDTLKTELNCKCAVLFSGKIVYLAENEEQGLDLWEYKPDAMKLSLVNSKNDINPDKYLLAASNTGLYLMDIQKGNPAQEYWIYDSDIPLAPDVLVSDSVSSDLIHLKWNDNSQIESGYIIERGDSYYFTPLDTVEQNMNEYFDKNVQEKTSYKYRIKAVRFGSVSDPSNVLEASTLQSFPLKPANLNATSRNETSVNLTWSDSAFNESKYYIERSEDSIVYTVIDSLIPNSTAYYDTKNIKEDFTYFYRVYCVNERGKSKFATIRVKTVQSLPLPPNHLKEISVTESGVTLNWRDSSYNEGGYFIERSLHNNYSYQLLDSLPANNTEFQDIGLKENEVYYYRVYAKNFRGSSSYSPEIKVRTLIAFPLAPSELSSIFRPSGEIELRWEDNSTNESMFYIERAMDSRGPFEIIDSVQSGITVFKDNKISSEPKEYYYKVCAANLRGKSDLSNVSEVSSLLPPSGVTARAVSYKEVALDWQSVPLFETGYVIIRRTYYNDKYFTESIIDTADRKTTKFLDTVQIHQNTRYGYVIYSINPTGSSAVSNESVTITPFATDISSSFLVRSVYPNPCTDFLYLEINQELKGPLRVLVIDESGKIAKSAVFNTLSDQIALNLSDLRKGYYFIQIESISQKIYSGKIFKK